MLYLCNDDRTAGVWAWADTRLEAEEEEVWNKNSRPAARALCLVSF